jgi:hypothetical protein
MRREIRLSQVNAKYGSYIYFKALHSNEYFELNKRMGIDRAVKIFKKNPYDSDFEGYHYHNTKGYSLQVILNDTCQRLKMRHCLRSADVDTYYSERQIKNLVKNDDN